MPVLQGRQLRLEIFGASHDAEIGLRLEGLPAGESVDAAELQRFLNRRAPGRSAFSTARKEADEPEFRGGLRGGVTDGSTLEAVIRNTDVRSGDYDALRAVPRPGHADLAARLKYGPDFDLRGGGPFSGRLTAPLCVAGGVCLQLLGRLGVTVGAHALEIAGVRDHAFDPLRLDAETLAALSEADFPVLNPSAGEKMRAAIAAVQEEGDSVGGLVECAAVGLPAGLGGPLFEGLEGRIAQLVYAIPAVKGVEFGSGFSAARLRGSENNDPYYFEDAALRMGSNNAGGILGGISTGAPLLLCAAVKPTPSIARAQRSVNLQTGENVTLRVGGRHDPCIVPRAVPVVEAAAAIALYDAWLEFEKER